MWGKHRKLFERINMKFLLLSDMHLTEKSPTCRTDDIFVEQFKKLEYVFNFVRDNGFNLENQCPILQAGDLFHKPRSWKCLHKLIWLMNQYEYLDIYCVAGQHDMYMRTDESTALSILMETDRITRIDDDSGFVSFCHHDIHLYGAGWGDCIPEVEDPLKTNILIIHAPITDTFVPYNYHCSEHILNKYKDFDLILCGDIHKMFHVKQDNRHIINTGPLTRMTADTAIIDHEPCFFVYDTKTKNVERHVIPHKNSIECITREHINKQIEINAMLDKFVIEIKKKVKKTMEEDEAKEMDIINMLHNVLKTYDDPDKAVTTIISKLMEGEKI